MTAPSLPPVDWQTLTELTRGRDVVVERVRLADSGIAIEGAFALPELAKLTFDDQLFVAAFIRAHGSIKEMEQVFGVSYPTIKARLNRLAAALDFGAATVVASPTEGRAEVLGRLRRGEITPDQAVTALEALK
jgi:hypothetical protein